MKKQNDKKRYEECVSKYSEYLWCCGFLKKAFDPVTKKPNIISYISLREFLCIFLHYTDVMMKCITKLNMCDFFEHSIRDDWILYSKWSTNINGKMIQIGLPLSN